MAESMSGTTARCPWCSAELAAPGADRCSACGAALGGSGAPEPEIRGVTTLDPEAILRARSEISRPRSRILSFITGEPAHEAPGPASAASLAPPPAEVRREILRLQHQAERADLEAETVALKADVLAQRGIHVSQLGGAEVAAPSGLPGASVDGGTVVAEGRDPVPPPAPGGSEAPRGS